MPHTLILSIVDKFFVNSDIEISFPDPRQYEELFNVVMTATDDNKKLLNTHFQLLPSKTKYPEYYEVGNILCI